jgi:hypothetical protein
VPAGASGPHTGVMSGTYEDRRQRRGGHRIALLLRPAAGWAAAVAASATLLAACGGAPGSSSTAGTTPSSGTVTGAPATATGAAPASAAPTTSAAQAAGGSMGCLAGTWRTNSISVPQVHASGGAGGILTISPGGAFSVNYNGIQPMTFNYNGVKGSMQYSGQASGQLHVSGDKLSGVTRSSTFNVKSQINGVAMNLPLPKVTPGTTAPWIGYTCAGNTLTLIQPSPGGSWTLTRTS